MNRADMLLRASERREPWDMLVVGGGATGVGVAVDAASRGYSVLLVERGDFGSGTSSRSTKLAHGGVRYLRQGHIGLVMEALRERGRLRQNAPHIVHDLEFIVPCYSRLDIGFYGFGLTVYDLLAGKHRFGRSHTISATEVVRRVPTVQTSRLRGGVVYHDGQLDDTRLLIHLVRTAANHGATLLNYASVTDLVHGLGNAVTGAAIRDEESGHEWKASARVVINAAGPFCDVIRKLADPRTPPIVAASQGSHVVLDRSFLPSNDALLVPKTPDGRVLFAIPWHGHTLVGTTDVPIPEAPVRPQPSSEEIDFILETAGRYLSRQPQRSDVLSAWAGVRPLVHAEGKHTASLARDHTIRFDAPGLLTITGGKWTTYRHMAEDCVNQAAALAGLPRRQCVTQEMPVHGYYENSQTLGDLAVYGSDAAEIQALIADEPALAAKLHSALPYCEAEVIWAARMEMARTVEDVLARRTRALFLNARAAIEMAPRVATLLAQELGRNVAWVTREIAQIRSPLAA
jgi:glycerol-3-phosphate dehydrogenase